MAHWNRYLHFFAVSARRHGCILEIESPPTFDRCASTIRPHDAALKPDALTLEINAEVPTGAPDNAVRTVTENCRTLKYSDHGFEKE